MRRAETMLVAAFVLSALVLLGWASLAQAPLAPPAPAGAAASSAVATGTPAFREGARSSADAVAADPPGAAAPRTAAEPGVFGLLLDNAGTPLQGFEVVLDEAGARSKRLAITDADGRFRFQLRRGGQVTVSLRLLPAIACTFVTEPVHHHDVVLRVPPTHVVTRGRLLRHGEPADGVVAVVRQAGHELARGSPGSIDASTCSSSDGVYTLVLPSGELELVPRDSNGTPTGPCLQLRVPSGVARWEWQFEIGGTEVEVVVRDTRGRTISGFEMRVVGDDEACGAFTAKCAFGETSAVVRWLPPGRFCVEVTGDELLEPTSTTFATSVGLPSLRVPVVVAPAAVVHLVVETEKDPHFKPAADHLPPLVCAGRTRPCVELRRPRQYSRRSKEYGFVGVPEGRAELSFADRHDAHGVVFLPFDSPPGAQIDVVAGQDNVLRIVVVPRAFVVLRACDARGRERPAARLELFHAGLRVVASGRSSQQRWQGHLPPGTYSAIVVEDGTQREHRIVVERQDLDLRLRP